MECNAGGDFNLLCVSMHHLRWIEITGSAYETYAMTASYNKRHF